MASTHTRLWISNYSDTAVQLRDDTKVKVWMHTNIGWVPTDIEDAVEAEQYAESFAESYELYEVDADVAADYL